MKFLDEFMNLDYIFIYYYYNIDIDNCLFDI